MDKPTTPDPADLGVLVPGTEEYKQAKEALEAIRKTEEADPELRRKRQREAADANAVYARFNGRNGPEAGRQEELIRDARKYAESYLAEAHSPEDRLKITRHIWNDFIPKHPNREAFRLQFGNLHSAIWMEGYPSMGDAPLEDRASASHVGAITGEALSHAALKLRAEAWTRAAEGGFPKANQAGATEPSADESTRTETGPTVNGTIRGGTKRLRATVTSPTAARRMEVYMESNGVGQTEFAIQAGTTDRTLRTFRRTGKVRRDIFEAIAKAMGTTREALLKPE